MLLILFLNKLANNITDKEPRIDDGRKYKLLEIENKSPALLSSMLFVLNIFKIIAPVTNTNINNTKIPKCFLNSPFTEITFNGQPPLLSP